MGLFNFIYKLTIIFSNKKKMKVFIILAIVIILIFAWSRGVFASTSQDDETLMLYQLQLQENFIQYMRRLYQNRPNGYDATAFTNICTRLLYYQCYVTVPTGDPNCLYWVYFYEPNSSGNNPNLFTTDGTFSTGLNSGTPIDCMLGNISCSWGGHIYQSGGGRTTPVYITTSSSCLMPSAMYMVRSTYITEFLEDLGYFPSLATTFNTSDAELQAVTSAGFNSVNNSIQQQTNTMTNSINSASSSISNTINSGVASVTNTITDDSVSVTSEDLPTDDTTDPTSTGLNSIFTMIQTAFTGTPTAVSFPIPFTNQSFTIQPGFTENSMRKGGLATMVNVIHLYWYYRIYSFIFLKYVELLEHIKEGEFEETVGNIKKEVL